MYAPRCVSSVSVRGMLARLRDFHLKLSSTVNLLVVSCVLFALGGCTAGHDAFVQSVLKTVERTKPAEVPFDPKLQYLRTTHGANVGWMWRGAAESRPDGLVEVFFSTPGEVLRLQNGRVVGASGLTTEWRSVRVDQPSWSEVASAGKPVTVLRRRDVMPGYRSGVQDELLVQVVPPPARSALTGLDPAALTWFEERSRAGGPAIGRGNPDALPPARYAVDLAAGRQDVVYAEQCLALHLCITWQRWSAAMQKSASQTR